MLFKNKKIVGFLILFLVMLMSVAMAACGGGGAGSSDNAAGNTDAQVAEDGIEAEGPQYGGTLKLVWDITADSKQQIGIPWDVIRTYNTLTIPYLEPLLLQTTTGDIYPFLAESYEVDLDTPEVRLKLREGVKFHDGTEMTAEDVAWCMNQWIEGKIINAHFLRGEARGDYEVALVMDEFQSEWKVIVSSHQFGIISKANYDKYGPEDTKTHPCGTGPFIVSEINEGQGVKYVKNPDYWQEGKPYLDGMEFVEITDTNTQKIAMLSGTGSQAVDVLFCSNVQQAASFSDTEDISIVTRMVGPVCLYPDSINKDSPLSKLEVRQAISYAIDRDAIVEATGFGINTPAYQIIPDGWRAHLPDSENLPGYDPEKAKELLAAAGYPDGFAVNIMTGTTTPGVTKDAVEAVSSMLAAVGIKCATEYVPNAEKNQREMEGWDGFIVTGARALPEINTSFRMLGYDLDYQFYKSIYRDPDVLGPLLQKSFSSPNEDAETTQAIHRWALTNVQRIPIYNTVDSWAVKDYVHDAQFEGWGMGTLWRPDLVWMEAH